MRHVHFSDQAHADTVRLVADAWALAKLRSRVPIDARNFPLGSMSNRERVKWSREVSSRAARLAKVLFALGISELPVIDDTKILRRIGETRRFEYLGITARNAELERVVELVVKSAKPKPEHAT